MKLDEKFFKGNRAQLLKNLDLDDDSIVIVPGNTRLQQQADQAHKLLQDSNFFYLSGVNYHDCILVITNKFEALFIPDHSQHASQWDGQLSPDEAQKVSGVDRVLSLTEGWQLLKRYLPRVSSKNSQNKIYIPKPDPVVSFDGIYANPARRQVLERLKADFPMYQYLDLSLNLAELRSIKQPAEIDAIRKAIEITEKSMKSALSNIKHGTMEYEIEAELTKGYRSQGADHAYSPIVAGAERACVLHYSDNNRVLQKGRLLLVDSAARYQNYAADITRTVSINSKPTKRQQAVIEAVESVHNFAFSQLKPELQLDDYEESIEKFMGEELKKLGLIKDINSKNVRKYFPHATGHFLGLDVHDVGPHDAVLRTGMVLTVEPGIYIPKESIGVRLENNVLITEDSAENLSSNIPNFFS